MAEKIWSILVVDDEPALTQLADDMLSIAGYQVTTCTSGHDALNILTQQRFDLLFTDLIMPGMTGYRLVHEVQRLYPDLKILLTSGYQINQDQDYVSQELLDRLVSKPYGDKQLLKAVSECLHSD